MITTRDELDLISATKSIELVNLSFNHWPIDNKWILKDKHKADESTDKVEAHLVAKGYT